LGYLKHYNHMIFTNISNLILFLLNLDRSVIWIKFGYPHPIIFKKIDLWINPDDDIRMNIWMNIKFFFPEFSI
jgi:hypothetical protein